MPSLQTISRIKSIQSKLELDISGRFDQNTALCLLGLTTADFSPQATLFELVVCLQNFLRCDADGIVGPQTLTRIENFLSTRLPALSTGTNLRVSVHSLDMLIAFEISSAAMYNQHYQKPIWPGGASGITIGIGYDLGYNSPGDIVRAWEGYLDNNAILQLQEVAGLTGEEALKALSKTQSIIIPYTSALNVFYQSTLPIYARSTRKLYPGIEKLPPDVQGALLSLVYNRGTSTKGDSRKEMKKIIDYVALADLKKIAQQIRNMKRLWEGKNLPGLLKRRDQEADMIEQASFNLLSEDIILL